MKQKRALVWSMLVALLLTLVPFGAVQTAHAATPSFFIPDNSIIAGTANMQSIDANLTRASAYKTTSKTIGIDGVFSVVDKDTLTVTVEGLLKDPVTLRFSPDTGHTYSKAVTASSANRFTAPGLTVYPGFNRITFTGVQSGIQKSDVFYVLFDQVPYLNSFTVSSGANPPVSLNQGSSIVVTTKQILLQGVAPNATSITVNGSQASVQDDGTFFAPSMNLTPGLNTITMAISNSANSANVTRTLYYYDPLQPFTQLDVVTPTDGAVSLLNTAYSNALPPVVTDTTYSAKLNVTMLAPYSPTPFSVTSATYSAVVTLNGTNVAPSTNIISQPSIPGPDGITPAYRLISFTVNSFPFQTNSTPPPTYKISQPVALDVYYNSNDTIITPAFTFYPGDKVIQKVSLVTDPSVPAAPAIPVVQDLTSAKAVAPLDGSEVTSPNFYIIVQADKQIEASHPKPYTTPDLTAQLLPISTTPLGVAYVGDYTVSGTTYNNIKVYQISGLPSGKQQISFKYTGSQSAFIANVSYVSKDYITVDSLTDGQTITFNSNVNRPVAGGQVSVNVSGNFLGTDPLQSFNFAINGKSSSKIGTTLGAGNSFNFIIDISGDPLAPPDLTVGQNTLTFTGTYSTGNGIITVTKDIKIYVVDTNVPALKVFSPAAFPSSGPRIALPDMSSPTVDTTLSQILADPTNSMTFQTNKYVTSLKSYDLVFRFTGAEHLLLKRGSDLIVDVTNATITATGTIPASTTNNGYNIDISGSTTDFILRIKDLQFATNSNHVYTVELTNAAGAKISQRLEIERQVSSFRIVAPVPNSGNKIVVTKNFVRVDIEAESADQVLVDGNKATPRSDITDRYIYDYYGLKPDKETQIKVQVKRKTTTNATISVFYSSDVNVNAEYMEKLSTKHTVFGGDLQLSFPKGTVLKDVVDPTDTTKTTKYYPDNKLLFGIADPNDGVVGRRNDYGNILGIDNDQRSYQGQNPIYVSSVLKAGFTNIADRRNFATVSPIYWISGGLAQTPTASSSDGIEPYSLQGTFTLYSADRKLVPSDRGTLTLHYDNNVVTAATPDVTVFYMSDKGKWINIGGVVDTSKHTITVPLQEFGYYMVTKLKNSFTDVTSHPWARNVLEALYSKGYMNNLYFSLFGADDLATRGEFATLLVKAANLPLNYDNNPSFNDIGPGAIAATWSYDYIETAARAGIINGLDGNFFGPNLRLTREQAATMIVRALKLKTGLNDSKLDASLSKTFTDGGTISYYAKPSVDPIVKAGIITGKPNVLLPGQKTPTVYFDPLANLTRAEAGQIAVRLLQKSTKVFPSNLN